MCPDEAESTTRGTPMSTVKGPLIRLILTVAHMLLIIPRLLERRWWE